MRRRITLGALSAVALLLLLFSFTRVDDRRSPVAVQPDDGPEHRQERAAAPAEAKPTRSVPQRVKPVTSSFGRPNPVIDRVYVDKLEVCRGEENFAHVDVHTVDGTDAALKISLAGAGVFGERFDWRQASVSPARAHQRRRHAPRAGLRRARNPRYRTGPLRQGQRLRRRTLSADRRTASARAGHRRVRARGRRSRKCDPVEREVDVRDAHSATSPALNVVHDYSNRRQLTAYSSFLITVTATDNQGRTLRGSRTIELVNQDYWKSRRGT